MINIASLSQMHLNETTQTKWKMAVTHFELAQHGRLQRLS